MLNSFANQLVVGKRSGVDGITHFRFVVGDDFDPFSESHVSMYAIHNLEGRALQVNALLEAEGGEVLSILVQHLSIKDLIAIWITQLSPGDWDFSNGVPNDQSSSGPDVLPLSEWILRHRADREAELCEAWDGGSGDHYPRAGRGKGGRKRGCVSASMSRVYKGRWDP